MELALHRIDDLGGHALLNLETTRVALDEPGHFREPGDATLGAGQVRHVREAHERYEVMLAERREGDVANHHHLVVIRLERDAQVLAGVRLEPLEELHVHVRHPARRVEKAVARRILANRLEELADEPLHASVVDHGHTSPVKV